MGRRFFGTDGIRGRVGDEPLTVEFALRLASAASRVLAPEGGTVVIGKDTRVSGYMFESALEAGFVAAGTDVLLLGPIPTPAIAYLTHSLGVDAGVVISASHNPYYDNGIKFFDRDGRKLSDHVEVKIERLLLEAPVTRESEQLGRASRVDSGTDQYQWFCLGTVPTDVRFSELKIVIDGAHGAGYKVAPRVLTELGADVIPIGCSPNGRNINDGCGSTQPKLLQMTVKGVGADLGIALDGDGDRVVMVDHAGNLIDGDQLLYVIANARNDNKSLVGPVVGTLMSNLGLEKALKARGIPFVRAQVGDRYVREMLQDKGGQLGGESSGHIIDLRTTTTGDGLVVALQILAIMTQTGLSLAELVADMPRYPQALIDVPTAKTIDLAASVSVRKALAKAEQQLADRGRVLVRASGTEPVIRVMVEGENATEVTSVAEELAESVRQVGIR